MYIRRANGTLSLEEQTGQAEGTSFSVIVIVLGEYEIKMCMRDERDGSRSHVCGTEMMSSLHCLLDKSKSGGGDGSSAEDNIASGIGTLDGEEFASVPGQMPQAIDSVEGEGSGKDEFSSVLDGFGEITDKVNDMCAVKGSGGDEVGDGEPVEQDTETSTSHTVGNRSKPCELRLVDGEMRAAGALQALTVENGITSRRCEALGLNRSS